MSVEPLEGRRLLAADAADPRMVVAAPANGVVIIDSSLISSIPREEFAGSLVIGIDGGRDAVNQITTALSGLADIDAVRLISHGSDGALWFGTQAINTGMLAARASEIAGWGRSLTADADILLYGCSVASTDPGRAFVVELAELTHADVAASTNPTGAGGDDTLEFQVGDVSGRMLAAAAAYDRAGVSLDINTYNSSIANWTNNQNGTVTVTMKYDISGLFYVAGGSSSPTGYVYMYLNGTQVARQLVTVDQSFTEYGSSGVGSVTRGSKNLLFTATFAIPLGDNEISVSPREGVPTQWSDPNPHSLLIEAPRYYEVPASYTAPAGQSFYAAINVLGTPSIVHSATGLPSGLSLSATGHLSGAPASGIAGTYSAVLSATNGFGIATHPITITVTNQAPSFATTNPAVVSGATESMPFTISYAALAAALDDSDPNGDLLSFQVESVLSGTLSKNGSPVTAGSTLIASGESLVWTPPPQVNDIRDAFTVRARDKTLPSATAKTVRVAIGAVNDPPTLMQFSGPVATGTEDSAIAISFADLLAKGDEADIDSTVTAFVVKEVTAGTLRIGTSEASAAAWDATMNKAITGSLNAYWTPDANAHGPQSAFKAVARDDGNVESVTPIQAVVTVNPVNDVPTLTSIAIISGANGSDPFEIASTSLANAANAADVDNDAIAFRIEAVSSGSLAKWTGSAWTAVVPGTTLLAAGEKLRWTPVAGSSGLRNAFTVKAWDGQLASATAIQVRIDGDRWRVLPWTDAASSGITPTHRYTHAYSFGAAGSFAVNGVTFTGIAGGNPSVTGRLATTGFGTAATGDANNLADATRSLATDAIASSATSPTVTLRGLTPGGRYVLSVFTVGLENGTRLATLSSSLGQVTVNENEYGDNNGVRIDYQYLADASGSVTITLAVPGSSFNIYGLANREHGAAIRLDAPTSLVYDAGPKPFQASVLNYATASNSPFVSAGVGHTVLLKADGTVTAYGSNSSGQTDVPAGLTNVVAVSAGGSHTLALKSDGTVVAWGSNSSGQTTIPSGLANVVAVSAGKVHNLALKSDGTVVAWGSNASGQAGVPAGLSGIVAISAGSEHSLALKADGTVVAWGHGFYDYATPPADLTDVVAISAGEWHSLALKSDGTVTAWGNNGSFQSQVPSGLKGVVAVSAGTVNSVAIKSDGTVVSWGDRDGYTMNSLPSGMPAGLSGVAAIDVGSYQTVALKSDGTVVTWGRTDPLGQRYLPTALGPLTAVSTGNDHTLAVKTDGTVTAWGGNAYGQTNVPAGLSGVVAVQAGDQFSVALKSDRTVVAWGAPIGTVTNAVAMPAGLADVTQISASEDHALALKANGTVVAWGDNSYGQSNVPAGLTGVVAVAAGGRGSLALKADGTVVYWGSSYGSRGAVPVGLTGVRAIAAGGDFSLALKTDGTVIAWGDDTYGQSSVPAGLAGVIAIEAGQTHALALKADGSIVAWGSVTEVPSTTRGVGVISLAAGWNNAIALKSDGTIIAWGNNHRGQNSPPAAATFPAVGLAGRLLSLDAPSLSSRYQGRGTTVYTASATPPSTSGDYTVTVSGTAAGNNLSISRAFSIAKVTPSVTYVSRVNTIAYGTPLSSDQVASWTPSWWNQGTLTLIPGTAVYSPAVGAVLPVGTQTLQVTFLPTDSVNFNPAIATGTITVTKAPLAAADISLTPPGSLTYDGRAKPFTATASVSGFTYTYSGRAGTTYGPSSVAPTNAGSYTVTATVDDPSYTGTKSLDFAIARATPTITANPTATAITFGQTLAASTLSGGAASVPGGFAFASSGTSPSAGTWSYDVVFTPTDSVNYATSMGVVAVTTNPLAIAAGAFTFAAPGSLAYNGSPKGFSATAAGPWGTLTWVGYSYAGISGTSYGPSSTPPTNAGSYAVTATLLSPNFSGSATQTFAVTKITPSITWATPASIAYGTPLSAAQLNAAANVPGAFVYTPAAGTVLGAGGRTLEAVFTPTDTTNYATVAASVPLQVTSTARSILLFAPPSLTYDGSAKAYVVAQNVGVSAGSNHTLVLKADGTVVAWGNNSYGQATVPAGLSGVVQVSAGESHSVAVKSNGTIVGWGSNNVQQFTGYPLNLGTWKPGDSLIFPRDLITDAIAAAAGGLMTVVLRADGTVTVLGNSDRTSTLNVPAGLTGVTAVAAGYNHAVALKSDGTVVAWGGNPSQDYGQATVPAGLSGVVAIAAGSNHTLALKADGTVVGWGNDAQGQASVPSGLAGVIAITAGLDTSYAIKADGTVVGWGSASNLVVPAKVTGVASLALGNQHAVAIRNDGTVAAWGGNAYGQATVPTNLAATGNISYSAIYSGRAGTTYAASASAPTNAGNYTVTVTSADPNYSGSRTVDFTIAKATPAITTLPQAALLVEGQSLSAALLDGGEASVTGTFAFTTPSFVPSAGLTTQGITFTPGDSANYASVTATVTVRSQGAAAAVPSILTPPIAAPLTFGQRLQASTLGGGSASVPGTFVFSSRLTVPNPGTARQGVTFIPDDIASYAAVTMLVPLTIYDAPLSPLNVSIVPPPTLAYDGSPKAFRVSRNQLLSANYYHGLAVNSDGTVTAFGRNEMGSCDVPAGLSGVVAVSTGDGISLALKSDGTVVEWGGDAGWGPLYGRPPAGLTGVVAIARAMHGLALKSDGTVVAWGENNNGQCNVPAGLNSVVAIAASHYASFALKSDGTVVTWGGNAHGEQLAGLSGVIAIDASPSGGVVGLKADGTVVTWGGGPPAPADLNGVVAVAAGSGHMAALKSDGTVVAWGDYTTLSLTGASYNLVPSNLSDVVAISAGSNRTYALKSDGSVVWWGQGSSMGPYKVDGRPVFFEGYGYMSVPEATPLAGVSAGFAFATTYTGREGTTYAASSTPPTDLGDYSVTIAGTDPDFAAAKTLTFSIVKGSAVIRNKPLPSKITYGQTLADYALVGGVANVPGTFAFQDPTIAPKAGASPHMLVFTPTDTEHYTPMAVLMEVLVDRATPSLIKSPTASPVSYGQTLANSVLSGGQATVPGTFAFAKPTMVPYAGTAWIYDAVFTPTDTANYAPFTVGNIGVTARFFDAVDDSGDAGESGGSANAVKGSNATGNVISNDPVHASLGGGLAVTAIAGSGGEGTVGLPLAGRYGMVTLLGNGDYTYVVDDTNAAVQALAPGATLLDSFTYSVSNGASDESAVLRIRIHGLNDAPALASIGPGPVASGTEDNQAAVTFAMIQVAADATDVDGSVAAFVVRSVVAGTLLIGPTPESATPWNAVSNAVIDATHNAFWTPAANATGTQAALSVVARDDRGLDSASAVTIDVGVAPVNDAPVNTVPAAQVAGDGQPLVFSLATGNRLSVADVDAADSAIEVTLFVTHGMLTLAGIAGLTFMTGDGTADPVLTFRGMPADVNAAIAGLRYLSDTAFDGRDELTVITSDLGASGAGGALTDTDTVAITVVGGVSVPGGQTATDAATHTGSYELVKKGGGTIILDKANSHSGGTVVEAGTIVVKNGAALGSGQVRVKAGASIVIDPAAGEAVVGSLVVDEGGYVDLGTGRMLILGGMTPQVLRAQILAAQGDGFWTSGTGLGSAAAADALQRDSRRVIGWLDNGDGSFTVGLAAPGDSNLDDLVDVLDAANFLAGGKYDAAEATTWTDGDSNYDGILDILDTADFLGSGLFDQGVYERAEASSVTSGDIAALSSATSRAFEAAFVAIGTTAGSSSPTAKRRAFAAWR